MASASRLKRDRLFHQDMLASVQRRDGSRGMLVGRIADIDEIDVRIVEEVIQVAVFLDLGKIHLFSSRSEIPLDSSPVAGEFFRVAAADGGNAGTFHFAHSEIMDHAHETNSYDPDPYH